MTDKQQTPSAEAMRVAEEIAQICGIGPISLLYRKQTEIAAALEEYAKEKVDRFIEDLVLASSDDPRSKAFKAEGYRQGIEDAAKVAESRIFEAMQQLIPAEKWLSEKIRALAETKK